MNSQEILRSLLLRKGVFVHPTSEIEDASPPVESQHRIGANTKIWRHCHIMPEAHIGKNCTLGQNVYVGRGVSIGNRCKIQNNVSVYKGVTLEDEVFVGPSAVFTNDMTPRAAFPKEPSKYPKTLVKRGATIGANATIVCGVTIGEAAFVAAGAVVTSDVPDFHLVAGVPARDVGWVCRCGIRLGSQDIAWMEWECESCERLYYWNGDKLMEMER